MLRKVPKKRYRQKNSAYGPLVIVCASTIPNFLANANGSKSVLDMRELS